jgi:hypothetical protein
MSESGPSIILKRSEHWIGIDLVARAVQETATIVATDIVTVRGNSASVVGEVGTRAGFQHSIPDLERSADGNAAAVVAANRAIRDAAPAIDSATRNPSVVAANRAVNQCYGTGDPAATTKRLAIMLATSSVAADCAVGDH